MTMSLIYVNNWIKDFKKYLITLQINMWECHLGEFFWRIADLSRTRFVNGLWLRLDNNYDTS